MLEACGRGVNHYLGSESTYVCRSWYLARFNDWSYSRHRRTRGSCPVATFHILTRSLHRLPSCVGVQSVTTTSDTIPAVLFEGARHHRLCCYGAGWIPMAKKGQAGRAYGAASTASVCGGLFGAVALALAIPLSDLLSWHWHPRVACDLLIGAHACGIVESSSAI